MPVSPIPPTSTPPAGKNRVLTPVHFFLRGLAIVLPTILTVVIVLWILGGINTYIISPATSAVKWVLAQALDESVPVGGLVPLPGGPDLEGCGRNYLVTPETRDDFLLEIARQQGLRLPATTGESPPPAMVPSAAATVRIDDDWLARREGVYVPFRDLAVPYQHFLVVYREVQPGDMPRSATGVYMDYAAARYFGSLFHLSAVAVALIAVLLYFIGRFVNVKIGHWLVSKFESGVLGRLPIIRNVYGSAKQVTEFLFSDSQVEYHRVVSVEYPRRGMWSLGLVTGDGMLDITTAVGEPCVTVLVPSSPMPMGGFTLSLPRSQVLDLNLSVDQAMQFCISCGVLVPPQQRVTAELLREHLEKRFSQDFKPAVQRKKPLDDSTPGPVTGGNGEHRPKPASDLSDSGTTRGLS